MRCGNAITKHRYCSSIYAKWTIKVVAPFHFLFAFFYYSRILLCAFNLMPFCQRGTMVNCDFLLFAIFHRISLSISDGLLCFQWQCILFILLFCSYARAYTPPMANAGHRRFVNSATYCRHPFDPIRRFCFYVRRRLHQILNVFQPSHRLVFARGASQMENALFMYRIRGSTQSTEHTVCAAELNKIISVQSRIDCRLVSTHIRPVFHVFAHKFRTHNQCTTVSVRLVRRI